ncbi:MAG: thioredoxin domain-containing protein [Elusimicrobia bacterium]|nr:thioredoxin domain-containing protein [Elusimicrobiota bacterium]
MLNTRPARRAAGAALIIAASLISAFASRGLHGPIVENAPAYRQKGVPGARIAIVEYSDFQCPACRVATEPLKRILELYGNDVVFTFKHFPLQGIHPWAKPAAIAAECAGRQGRFWPYHDKLYEKQEHWAHTESPESELQGYAAALGLDLDLFKKCLADPEISALIDEDVKQGNLRWVGSTPTFFINEKRFAGAKQLSTRGMNWIDRQLKN